MDNDACCVTAEWLLKEVEDEHKASDQYSRAAEEIVASGVITLDQEYALLNGIAMDEARHAVMIQTIGEIMAKECNCHVPHEIIQS